MSKCSVCGYGLSMFKKNNYRIKNGTACKLCVEKTKGMSNLDCRTAEEFKERYAYLEENIKIAEKFNATTRIPNIMVIDENLGIMRFNSSNEYFPISCLLNYEVIEDGETVTSGGLGRAVVGYALMGGLGAVVGSVTGKKRSRKEIKDMHIRISLTDKWVKYAKIPLITAETKINSKQYANAKDLCEKIISTLERIKDQEEQANQKEATQITIQNNPVNASPTEEIMRLKQLLDENIITQEEFDQGKKKILGI